MLWALSAGLSGAPVNINSKKADRTAVNCQFKGIDADDSHQQTFECRSARRKKSDYLRPSRTSFSARNIPATTSRT